jgi:hypothetical protein
LAKRSAKQNCAHTVTIAVVRHHAQDVQSEQIRPRNTQTADLPAASSDDSDDDDDNEYDDD